jgi:hypothetical protein
MFMLMSPDEDERNAHDLQLGKQAAARFIELALEDVPLLL